MRKFADFIDHLSTLGFQPETVIDPFSRPYDNASGWSNHLLARNNAEMH